MTDANTKAVVITTVGAIVESQEALGRLNGQPIEASNAFKVTQTIQRLREVTKTFYERRNVFTEKFGTPADTPNQWVLEGENRTQWEEAVKGLYDEEVRIPLGECLRLGDVAGAKLTPKDAESLSYLFVD